MGSPELEKATQYPDFIIGGAMKSATGTLDHILAQHDEIYIPPGEVHFFSVDDVVEHPGFFHKFNSGWAFQDFQKYDDSYRSWYENIFDSAGAGQTIGEDSTGYLASEKAPPRIAEWLPEVQLIFLLRDPVARAYSHYWDALRAGRVTYDFEGEIQYGKEPLLRRGFYRRQLERYYKHFSRDQITILIFQDFIENMQERVNGLCETLGVSGGIDLSVVDTTTQNASPVPRWPTLLTWQNRLFRDRNAKVHQDHLPTMPSKQRSVWDKVLDSVNLRLRYLNLTNQPRPPMAPETKSFLEKLYAKENRGLSELIGIDLRKYWPYMDA